MSLIKLDVEAWGDLPGQTLSEGRGRLVAGVVRLGQWFLTELLTTRGSIPADPDKGTFFLQRLRAGLVPDTAALQSEFALAALHARRRMQFLSDGEVDQLTVTPISLSVANGKYELNLKFETPEEQKIMPVIIDP